MISAMLCTCLINISKHYRGVDTFFKTLARLVSSSEFALANSKNNSRSWEKEFVREKDSPT
jgi:hypothetical protein